MTKKTTRRPTRTEAAVKASGAVSAQRPPSAARGAEFNPDYAPIIKDLRRIGILAGSFIFILIALSFFLR